MTAVQILASLGFVGSSVVNERKGQNGRPDIIYMKVWTTKGWSYAKFEKAKLEDGITAWARTMEPGTW